MSRKHVAELPESLDECDSLADFRRYWDMIRESRNQVAQSLDDVSKKVFVEECALLRNWSCWFRGDATFESLLYRPDILALALPVWKEREGDNRVSESVCIANNSFNVIDQNRSISRRAIRTLSYSLAIVAAFGALWFGYVVWLSPELRQIVEDFEIELPLLTQLFLGTNPWLHRLTWFAAVLAILGAFLVWLEFRHDRNRMPNSNRLDRWFMSSSCAIGIWCRHVAMLTEFGLSTHAAATIAVTNVNSSWLKTEIKDLLESNIIQSPIIDQSFNGNLSKSSKRPPFQLVVDTMQFPDSALKTSLLHENANYLLDRDQNISEWWTRLFANLIFWNIGLFVALFLVSMYGWVSSLFAGLYGGTVFGF